MHTVTAKVRYVSMQMVFSVMLILSLLPMWVYSCVYFAQRIFQNCPFRQEEYYESLPFRMSLLEWFSSFQSLLGKQEISDFAFFKDSNGYLHYSGFYRNDDISVLSFAQRIARLQKFAESKETKLLFVMPPGKYDLVKSTTNDTEWLNYPGDKIDELLMYLNRFEVKTLDLSDMDNAEFYKTDHHWTVKTAFEATKQLAETIHKQFGDNLDPTDYYLNLNYYDELSADKNMLGSMGRKAGRAFSGVDEFSVLCPKFFGTYERMVLSGDKEEITRGDIKQTLINLEYLEEKDIYKRSSYSVYLDGIKEQNRIVNLTARNNRTALIIHDSYFSPVICFLAPMFWKIDTIYNLEVGKTVNLETVIKDKTYDYIIFEVYPFNLNENSFQFYKEDGI